MKKLWQGIKREWGQEETLPELTARIRSDLKTRWGKDLEQLKKGWEKLRSKNRGG